MSELYFNTNKFNDTFHIVEFVCEIDHFNSCDNCIACNLEDEIKIRYT